MVYSDKLHVTDALFEKPIHEKCGVVAVWDRYGNAPFIAQKALLALQHRGQESAGITIYKKRKGLITYKNMGLIASVLTDTVIQKLGKARTAIAHNRYSTSGKSSRINCHPITLKKGKYMISIGHNGNIPDMKYLLSQVVKKPKFSSDTGLLTTILLQNRFLYPSWIETLKHTLSTIKGAFSLVIVTEDGNLFIVRDPYGIRPLCYGKTKSGWVAASESTALDSVGAHFIREVKRGEIISINFDGELTSSFFGETKLQKSCLFEHIYFSRPDSFINGKRVKVSREALGRKLGQRIRAKDLQPDIIIPIFNSGYYAAKGVAAELGLPMIEAIVTSLYHGRTFIRPGQEKRISAVNGKYNYIPEDVQGKKVLFVDDSAVRSTTSRALVLGLLHAGAKEIYAGFSSPPIVNPCDLGIDMKSKDELIASQWEHESLETIEKNVAQLIGAHNVTYLSLVDTIQAIGGELRDFYSYYFGGLHPLRSEQDVLPVLRKPITGKPKLVVLISGSGTNLQKIIDEIKSGSLDAEIACVVSNNKDAYGLRRAKKYKIPTMIIQSKGVMKSKEDRQAYDQRLANLIEKIQPDLVVLAGWMLILGDIFLQKMRDYQIPVLNLHPALLTEKDQQLVVTSRGSIPVLRGAHALVDAYNSTFSLSGVTAHQVLPGNMFDTGPIVLQEEVRRVMGETLAEWEIKIHQTEYRVLPTAIKRMLHVMQNGVDVSQGKFIW